MEHGNWNPGQQILTPVEEMVTLDPASMEVRELYKLLIGGIVPRPIAFVSTVDPDGNTNLAPFSFYNGVSSKPPCLMVSIGYRPDGTKKDTLRNIESGGEFVVNSANEWLIEPLVYTAGDFASEISEFSEAGLTPLESVAVKPPRVKEAGLHFECKLYSKLEIGPPQAGSSVVIVGEIVKAHIDARAYHEGRISAKTLEPVGRLGGLGYTSLGTEFDLRPPAVKR